MVGGADTLLPAVTFGVLYRMPTASPRLSTARGTIWSDSNRLGKAGKLLGWPGRVIQGTPGRLIRCPKEAPPSHCTCRNYSTCDRVLALARRNRQLSPNTRLKIV